MKEYTQCRKCNKYTIPKNKPPLPKGFYYQEISKQNCTYIIAKECECHKRWYSEKELYLKFKKSGFQLNLFNYNISTYLGERSKPNIERLQKYLSKINDKEVQSSFLYFYGKPGTQKTSVATYIGKQIILKDIPCKYLQMNDLILNLHKANSDENIKEEIDELEKTNILIIDEAFPNRSQWGGYFENFIKTRIVDGKGIIFISNTPIDMISQYSYGDNVQDLIKRELIRRDSLFIFEDHWESNMNKIPEVLF
jgi:DNA replication protein DnaC